MFMAMDPDSDQHSSLIERDHLSAHRRDKGAEMRTTRNWLSPQAHRASDHMFAMVFCACVGITKSGIGLLKVPHAIVKPPRNTPSDSPSSPNQSPGKHYGRLRIYSELVRFPYFLLNSSLGIYSTLCSEIG
ncbi:hypothetical protein V3C99_007309 [Haemonchus contortus]